MSIQMEAFKDLGNDFKSFFSFDINGFIDGVENGKAEGKKKKKTCVLELLKILIQLHGHRTLFCM